MKTTSVRLSVPRVSRLDYVIGILENHEQKLEITFDELFQTVKKIGFRIETERIKMSGVYRDITKEEQSAKYAEKLKSQTRDVIRLLKRWKIIEEIEGSKDVFRIVDSSKHYVTKICQAIKEECVEKARKLLYHIALLSGEQFLFPGKYALVLRRNDGVIDKENFAQGLGTVTINRPINPTSIDVITDWMSYFGYSDKFSSIQPDGKRKEIIVATKAVATLKEIIDLKHFLETKSGVEYADLLKNYAVYAHLSPFEIESILQCSLRAGLVKKIDGSLQLRGNMKTIIDQALAYDMCVVAESDVVARITENPIEHPPNSTFLITDFDLNQESFYDILYQATKTLKKTSYEYVWITDLRREVCKRTHIHSSTFDSFLREIYRQYGPSVIETAGVYADTFAAKKIKEIPLIVDGRPIYRIRLRREKL